MKTRKTGGFTLIELLVVIAIIALLLSIVMPAMRRAKFIAKRVVCSSQMKQGCTAFLCYATTVGDGKLPLGAMGGHNLDDYQRGHSWSQLDYIHETSWLPVKEYLEDARTMICTVSVPKERLQSEEWTGEPYIPSDTDWRAYWIGYNYHGGHFAQAWPDPMNPTRLSRWISPYKLTDSGTLPLLSDKICRSNNRDETFIGHSPSGPMYGTINQNPNEISGVAGSGGNIGYLDGSVAWKTLDKMKEYHRAQNYGSWLIQPGSTVLTGYW